MYFRTARRVLFNKTRTYEQLEWNGDFVSHTKKHASYTKRIYKLGFIGHFERNLKKGLLSTEL